ncbi:MAG TPA: hypothetical protein VMT38_11040 [Terracidiphilus sp.]|nr:hypothetical protein [Terracidiphilus sp.]
MKDVEDRLAHCFSAVFPELTDGEIRSATSETVRSWDSVAGVTLIAVVEEEFCVRLDSDDLSNLTSFQGFLSSLRKAEHDQDEAERGDERPSSLQA